MNTTGEAVNTSETNQLSEMPESAPPFLIALLFGLSGWIIIVNGLVFTCMIMSRHAMKNLINVQILSLSITDIVIGLSIIPLTLSFQITGSFPSYSSCSFTMASYIIPQCAALYHAFGICVHRLLSVTRKGPNCFKGFSFVIGQIFVTWLFSCSVIAVPFLVYGQLGQTLSFCSLNSIFGLKYDKAVMYINIAMLTPHVGVNVVYVYMFLLLKKKWNQITASLQSNGDVALGNRSTLENKIRPNSSGIDKSKRVLSEKQTQDVKISSDQITMKTVSRESCSSAPSGNYRSHAKIENQSTSAFSIASGRSQSCSNISPIRVTRPQKESSTSSHTLQVPEQSYKVNVNQSFNRQRRSIVSSSEVDRFVTAAKNKQPKATAQANLKERTVKPESHRVGFVDKGESILQRSGTSFSHGTSNHALHARRNSGQRRVLVTIGIILLVLNIFVTPMHFLFVYELISDSSLSRKSKFLLVCSSLINSGLNPIIYAVRMKPFRDSVRENFKRIGYSFCRNR